MKKTAVFLLLLFYANFAFGEDFIMSNVPNGCEADFFTAMFEPNTYNCSSGYYLPANTDGCRACLSGHTCGGGTFLFNETTDQGIVYTVPIIENVTNGCVDDLLGEDTLSAWFKPNEHTCTPGYYLPANIDECAQCPSGSACVGGTYSFNEITDQGIQSCASGSFSPTGSAVCYPHIFHVGNDIMYMKSVKQTTPSLNIQIGNDIFYINMTTTRTRMNKDSIHYFHVDWDDNHYYVCDDTMCPDAE